MKTANKIMDKHTVLNLSSLALTKVLALALLVLVFNTSKAQDLPGATSTSYGVSPSGAFNFSMPIIVPAGVNGVQPNLSISFSSSGGNGSMGVGAGISGLSAITRCSKSFAVHGIRRGVTHTNEDRLCLDGSPLIVTKGTYGAANSEYRTEVDQFSKVVAYDTLPNLHGGSFPRYFFVYRKDGSIWEYGFGGNSKFKLPGSNSIHSWNVSTVRDRHGNRYSVSYRSQDGYPDMIHYNGAHGIGDKVVDFVYQSRPDVRNSYVLGQQIVMNDRLKRVDVKKSGAIVRQYNFTYEQAPITERSRITAVQECGQNGDCMPAIPVDYQIDTSGTTNASSSGDIAVEDMIEYYDYQAWEGGVQVNRVKEINKGAWVDINGDGRVDQLIAVTMPNGSSQNKVYLKNADGTWSANQTSWALPRTLRNYKDSITNLGNGRFTSSVINQGQLADVNGDGLVDVVYSYEYITTPQQHYNDNRESVKETYLNTGSGWALSTAYAPVDLLVDYFSNSGGGNVRTETVRGRLIDINGDGLVDWVRAYHDYTSYDGNLNGHHHKKTWINNGNGWTHDPNYTLPDVFVEYKGLGRLPRGEFVDVNGDGLVDWVQAFFRSDPAPQDNRTTYLNTGTGFVASAAHKLPEVIYTNVNGWDSRAATRRGAFVDVNGDGLADWVRSYKVYSSTDSRLTRLNTGNGWVTSNAYRTPFIHMDHSYVDFTRNWPLNVRGMYQDLNGDGLVDYAESYKSSDTGHATYKRSWLNTGTGWGNVRTSSSDPYVPKDLYFDYSGRENARARFGDMVDINSDGRGDFVKARKGISRSTSLGQLIRPDRLQKITTTSGVEIKPSFLPLTANDEFYLKGTGPAEADAVHIAAPIYVTSELKVSNADGSGSGYNTSTYAYAGAQSHRLGRGSLGFKQFTTTDVDRGITRVQNFRQDFPFIGRVESGGVVATNSAGEHVLSATQTEYAVKTIPHTFNGENGNNTLLSYAKKVWQTTNELNDTSVNTSDQFREVIDIDDYGNPLESRAIIKNGLGEVLSDITTVNEYDIIQSEWLVGLITKSTVSASKPSFPTKVTTIDYDYKPGNRGLLEKRTLQKGAGDSTEQITQYTYDLAGNRLTETAASGAEQRINTMVYDSQNRLPISSSNAKNQLSTIDEHHPICDLPTMVADINGLITTTQYDNFCRETQVTSATGIVATNTYNTTGSCASCQLTPQFRIESTTTGQASVTTYYNQYQEPMVSETTGMLGETITQRTEYDQFGRKKRESQPYFSGDTIHYTQTDYDVLDRVTQLTLPYQNSFGVTASVSRSYTVDVQGRTVTTITDQEGRSKTSATNALAQVDRITDAHGKTLSYTFDVQGNLTSTIDSEGNTIVVGYDVLGRRTSLDDPDLGMTTYTYNAFNEQVSQTNAKLQTITMQYDELGRITQRSIPGVAAESGGISTWEYDTAPNGIGALAKANGPNGYQKTYSYDAFSRLEGDVTTIKGETYSQEYGYNANGQLSYKRYPDSGAGKEFSVHYNYLNGYLESITDRALGAAGCVEHWRADKYDALGRTKTETLGKLVTTNREYSGAQGVLDRIESIVNADSNITGLNTTTVQDLSYNYDSVNNVNSRTNELSSTTQTFSYDNLDRLISYQNGSETIDVDYDDIGNITYKSDVGTYSYNSAKPHALTRVDLPLGQGDPLAKFQVTAHIDGQDQTVGAPNNIHGQNFEYDANGNITISGDRRISWTAFDKPHRMERVDVNLNVIAGSDIEYDGDYNRIYKQENTGSLLSFAIKETTVYVGDYQSITDKDGNITHRYSLTGGGNAIQIDRDHNTDFDKSKYMLVDNLGSTNVILNALGEVEQTLEFDPWGMRTNAGDTTAVNAITNRGYTGHEMDDEIGLTNMNARIYDPYLGRFLSADPVLPDAEDMQAFNRYAYVINNPLKYTDPTGNMPSLDFICITSPCGGGFGGVSNGNSFNTAPGGGGFRNFGSAFGGPRDALGRPSTAGFGAFTNGFAQLNFYQNASVDQLADFLISLATASASGNYYQIGCNLEGCGVTVFPGIPGETREGYQGPDGDITQFEDHSTVVRLGLDLDGFIGTAQANEEGESEREEVDPNNPLSLSPENALTALEFFYPSFSDRLPADANELNNRATLLANNLILDAAQVQGISDVVGIFSTGFRPNPAGIFSRAADAIFGRVTNQSFEDRLGSLGSAARSVAANRRTQFEEIFPPSN